MLNICQHFTNDALILNVDMQKYLNPVDHTAGGQKPKLEQITTNNNFMY